MSGNLGSRAANGALSAGNRITPGGWVVAFPPASLPTQGDFEVWHGALTGPGGYVLIYLDDNLYGVAENGLINEYAPAVAMYVRKGSSIEFHWSIATGAPPKVTLYLREPEVGKRTLKIG